MNIEVSYIKQQLPILKEKFPNAEYITNFKPDYAGIISIPDFNLPKGWNLSKSDIHFDIPFCYPFCNPINFYVDKDLRLASGRLPVFINYLTFNNKKYLRFEYKVDAWNPNHDDLLTYVWVIKSRLYNLK